MSLRPRLSDFWFTIEQETFPALPAGFDRSCGLLAATATR